MNILANLFFGFIVLIMLLFFLAIATLVAGIAFVATFKIADCIPIKGKGGRILVTTLIFVIISGCFCPWLPDYSPHFDNRGHQMGFSEPFWALSKVAYGLYIAAMLFVLTRPLVKKIRKKPAS